MKILLDENFPLPLYYRLRSGGYDVEHIIVLGKRGLPDSAIIERLAREDLVFPVVRQPERTMPRCGRR